MTLATRLSAFFLATLAVVLAGFSISLYVVAGRYLHRHAEERLESTLGALSGMVEADSNRVEWEPEGRSLDLDSLLDGGSVVWLVVNDRGQVLDRSRGTAVDRFLAAAAPPLEFTTETKDRRVWTVRSWKAGQRWIRVGGGSERQSVSELKPVPGPAGDRALCVTAGVSLAPMQGVLSRLAAVLTGISAVIWLLALVAGRLVSRRALLPLRQMAAASRDIDADDLSARLPVVATRDELAEVNRAFNGLLDRQQIAFERQRRFTGEASHQLRTPLTAILGQIDVALRRDRPAEEYREVLTKVRRKATHLWRLTDSLLFLARANSEATLPDAEPVNLGEWLPRHLETWSDHSRAADLVAVSPGHRMRSIVVPPELLGELLDILIDNACKFSEAGTPITIRVTEQNESVSISVADQGIGIEPENLASLFAPFFRAESARRRGVPGVGLGLSIARRLAGSVGGELTVASQPEQGACFTLQWMTDRPPA